MTIAPVRSLYVHVPFCHTICGYCDFYSVVLDRAATGPLVDALLAELNRYRSEYPFELETVFVGGGTPTTLPDGDLRRLLAEIRTVAAAREIEFTVEANPATVTDRTAELLAECGVNRVSIGAQSFDPAELRVLERIHHPEQVRETVAACRRGGIGQVNLDLIFAVPGQSLERWAMSLEQALALEPDHLSCYGLTYEPGTPLFDQLQAGRVRRVDSDLEAEMYEATVATLVAAGFEQYEISNYARPGCTCRHNLVYWHNEPYLGVGPSAAGLVNGVRYRNVPDTAAYARAIRSGRSPRVEEERLTVDRRARETVMLELRLNKGIRRAVFRERFGHDFAEQFHETVEKHRAWGLLELSETHVRLTPRGRLVADSVIAEYL